MSLRYLCYPIVIGATLGGCANTASIRPAPAGQEIEVEQKSSVLFLQSLRGPERHRLRSFIAMTSRGRPDALHVGIIGAPRLIAQVAHEVRAMARCQLQHPPVRLSYGFAGSFRGEDRSHYLRSPSSGLPVALHRRSYSERQFVQSNPWLLSPK
ncbi:hypothetical protein ACVW0W_001651 [Bradyrhizobium sp. USDA 4469]